MRLCLLGRFRATSPRQGPIDLSGKKTQALLAYLALHPDRLHSRDQLATLLWADTGDERARHNLRQELSKIRRRCADLLVTEADTVRLADDCDSDVGEMRRLLSSADPADQARGVAMYRRELLDGLTTRAEEFDDWLSDERRRLRGEVSAALERLGAAATAAGRMDEAVQRLRHRLSLDPACEEAHVALMQALDRSGRRSEALRQYRLCEEALERELGALPSAATVAVYEDIRRAGAAPPAPSAPLRRPDADVEGRKPSIAVLPFDNLGDGEHRYFSDGVAEDIITALSRFGTLTVIARASSFAHRDHRLDLDQIGLQLGADYLVRGSVRKGEQRVRINVELLDSRSGEQVWSQRFDGKLEDVCLVEDAVTETLVATLAGRVEAARLSRALRLPPDRLDAYDYVLRGKAHHHRQTPEDCELAIRMLEQALARDPDYAVAHAWLACSLGQAMNFHPERKHTLLDRAQVEAQRGRELDDEESECHRVLAQIFLIRSDLDRALSHQERALRLNPNDDRSVCAMGEILGFLGRHGEAVDWIRKAMRLNPYHPESYLFHLGRSLFHLGRDEDAHRTLSRITQPRERDLAYRAAAAARLGLSEEVGRDATALRSLEPPFEPPAFVASLPFRLETDREALAEALRRLPSQ